MRKKIIISIILILIILTNTVSYATTEISVETLEESLRKLFSKNIQINGEFEGGTSSSKSEALKVEIGDGKIIIKEEGTENIEPISYVIEDNVCKFNHKYKINVNEDATEEDAFREMMMILMQQKVIETCYLATADATGVDLSLAYTYYAQKSQNNDQETDEPQVVNEVFKNETIVSEDETEYTTCLEIDLEKMSELKEEDLDSSLKYTVTLVDQTEQQECDHFYVMKNNEVQHWEECIKCNEQKDGTLEDHIFGQEVEFEDGKKTTICGKCGYEKRIETQINEPDDSVKDSTVADKEIPKAGAQNIVAILIGLGFIFIISRLKINKYKDI